MVSIRAKRLKAEAAAAAAAAAAAPIEQVDVLSPLEKLQGIQQELRKVNTEANDRIFEIKLKYMDKQNPIYRRRNEIISEIPDFWLKIFSCHPTIKKLLTEDDEEILGYLDSLNVENFEDPRKGYRITFNFKANPYFFNRKLTKTIKFLDKGTRWSNGTTINWKAGKGPVAVGIHKRPLPVDSFFSWFSSPERDEAELEQDLVSDIIKEKLWPNPMNCIDNADDFEDDEDNNDKEEEEDAPDEHGDDKI